MFEITDSTEATLTSVTPRTEVHGEDRVFAISLGLKLSGANTLLDLLSPTLRQALYMPVPGQDQLPGVEPSTPLRRSNLIEEVKVGQQPLEGWTLAVEHGIDEPIALGGCRVDKFRCVPHEGGSVDLFFRVGSNDIDAEEAGLLCSKLSQQVSFTLRAPEKADDPIDGSTEAFKADHPDAGDLFAEQHGDPDDADSEGGDPDIDGDDPAEHAEDRAEWDQDAERRADGERSGEAWPFPRGHADAEAPPQSVTAEPSRRTARGRAATKAALEAGRP